MIIKKKKKNQYYYYLVQRPESTEDPESFPSSTWAGPRILARPWVAAVNWTVPSTASYQLGIVGLIDQYASKRDQGLTVGEYMLLAAINRASNL